MVVKYYRRKRKSPGNWVKWKGKLGKSGGWITTVPSREDRSWECLPKHSTDCPKAVKFSHTRENDGIYSQQRLPLLYLRVTRRSQTQTTEPTQKKTHNHRQEMLPLLLALLFLSAFAPIRPVKSHQESGEWRCESDSEIGVVAEFRPGIVTIDGHADDWKDIDGFEFSLLPALDPDDDKEYSGGKMTVKVFVSSSLFFFLSLFRITFDGFSFLFSFLWWVWFVFRLYTMARTCSSCCRLMGNIDTLKG